MERSSSHRAASTSSTVTQRRAPNVDLFGDDAGPAQPRPNTTEPPISHPPVSKEEQTAYHKQAKQGDSLLGLDFFAPPETLPSGGAGSGTRAPKSSSGPSRPDLKQSILSLYSSGPKTAGQQPGSGQPGVFDSSLHARSTHGQPSQQYSQPSTASLAGAFEGLSFSTPHAQPQPSKPPPFAGFSTPVAPTTSSNVGFGGGFFDPAPKAATSTQTSWASPGGFDTMAALKSPAAPVALTQPQSSKSGDLFDLSGPPSPPKPADPTSPRNFNAAFNLTTAKQNTKPQGQANVIPVTGSSLNPALSTMDAWGAADAWSTPDKSSSQVPPEKAGYMPSLSRNEADWGSASGGDTGFGDFGATVPKVSADEDFGGWSSAAPQATTSSVSNPPSKPAGGFSGDDLFSNVWE